VYARLGAGRKMELAIQMSQQARETALRGIRNRNPSLSASDAREVLLRRMLGDALFDAAFGASTSP
jgi:hypothetical protein